VADQLHAVDAERVEHGEHVAGERLLRVTRRRSVRPAEAAQVEREHAVAGGERADDVTPLVPVLGPPVQQHDDVVAGPGVGDVEPDAVRVDEPMADPVEMRKLGWKRQGRGP
jgi:hypothetical protein